MQSLSRYFLSYFSLNVVFVVSLLFRILLLAYGEWQDNLFALKFTDVDYQVLTDAARYVLDGESPFARPTYRYSPLLAFLLTPNHQVFYSFGKAVFVLCDLLVGLLIYLLLSARGVRRTKITFSVALWLLNPLTATVSSRGNAESILAVLVLLTFYFLICRRVYTAAVFFGLAVHLKIFPVIYSLPIYLFINDDYAANVESLDTSPPKQLKLFFNPLRLKFVIVSSITFLTITSYFYLMYGDVLLEEAYLYHITRRDTRHNFSVYFYPLYLIQDSWLSLPVGLAAFLPQALLLLASAIYLHRDITLCCFVQTFILVTFNKVCTSQYFLWYLCLLPLITPYSKLQVTEGIHMFLLWFSGQAFWLLPAYLLEFQGYNTFVWIYLAGLTFFAINVFVVVKVLRKQVFTPTFNRGRLAMVDKSVSKLK